MISISERERDALRVYMFLMEMKGLSVAEVSEYQSFCRFLYYCGSSFSGTESFLIARLETNTIVFVFEMYF